jgi:hypothetical protein
VLPYNGVNWNGHSDAGGGDGDHSWNDTEHWGSSQFMFFEDNRFQGNGGLGDVSQAGRFVFRHNTSTNGQQMYWHSQNNGRPRGARAGESYLNHWNATSVASNPVQAINGGSMLFWGNTVTKMQYLVQIDSERASNHYPMGTPPNGWGECDGLSLHQIWDGPGPPAGYRCMDQPGAGRQDLLTGVFPNVVNVTQGGVPASVRADLSPIYIWNNIADGNLVSENEGPGYAPNSNLFQPNRDYYLSTGASCSGSSCTSGIGSGVSSARPANCTAGPGGNTPGVGYWATDTNTLYVCTATNTWTSYYTPYTYPHPLTQGTPPPQRTGPAAPTSLVSTVH